ncbi:MAG: hypothetical protein CM15mV60_510 [uncultured marine virus]|nr:MAG: hypothetical protein CM15mV60_510 [uncultured marine virus]
MEWSRVHISNLNPKATTVETQKPVGRSRFSPKLDLRGLTQLQLLQEILYHKSGSGTIEHGN